MEYEKQTIVINNKEHEVVHCLGHGQCKCKSCERKGKYYVSWTDWFYKLTEQDEEVVCYDCLKELLGVQDEQAN